MPNLKSLAKDTVIYGMSSIVGRFLNYLLVPLYTAKIAAASGGYGVVTNLYAYTALILVILTFGMETTLFRFANNPQGVGQNAKSGSQDSCGQGAVSGLQDCGSDTVFSTAMAVVGALSMVFLLLVFTFINPIAQALGYPTRHSYILIMAVVVALDAIQAIPFAYLRFQRRPWKFAALKLLFIILNIGLNIFYFLVLGKNDVLWVFGINLVCTGLVTFFFIPDLFRIHWRVDFRLLRRMLNYSWPILVLGIAGILNQTADKILYPWVKPGLQGEVELGIYGASVKIAMIMAMITQAFRYAYEPFVFGKAKDKDSLQTYAAAMKYFIMFTLLAYLVVVGWLPVLKYIIGPDYWPGLKAVPIVMAAEIEMGIYFNLSFWYKLTDRTIWGLWFSLAGCVVLVAVNILFIPRYGYMACAWGGVLGYGVAMMLSYFVGQKKYPIRYPLRAIFTYLIIAALFAAVMIAMPREWSVFLRLGVSTVLILLFVAHIVYHEHIHLPARRRA